MQSFALITAIVSMVCIVGMIFALATFHEKVGMLFCFVGSISCFFLCFGIANTSPPVYIVDSRPVTNFCLAILLFAGSAGLIFSFVFFVRLLIQKFSKYPMPR